MCPACLAAAAWVAAGVISTGGLTAVAAKLVYSKNGAEKHSSSQPKEKEK
jgi:hypothetical protein